MICSQITLTWYPGAPPSTETPLVLLSPTHHTEDDGNLAAAIEQLGQRADYVRGAGADFFPRRSRSHRLDFTEIRRIASPMVAAETALAIQAGMPTAKGWLKIELAGRATTWKAVPCVLRGVSHRTRARQGLLYLDWSLDCGPVSILTGGETPPTIYAPGEILAGPAIHRGAILLGPNRSHPED